MNEPRSDVIDEWGDVSARAARAGGYRSPPGPRARPLSVSIGLVAVAIIVVVGGLVIRPQSVANSPSPTPARASDEPVAASADDGMFRLDLSTPRGTYGPNDAITPVTSVTYLGPDATQTMYHGASPVAFAIEEVGGSRRMSGGMDEPCLHTAVTRDAPALVPFQKAGEIGTGFDQAWFGDPVLRLPVGTWKIQALLDVFVTDGTVTCGGLRHQVDVEIVVTVVGDEQSVGPSGSPAATPSPSLSADASVVLEFVRKYEDGLTTGHQDASWRFLSPWSRSTVGSATTFYDAEQRIVASMPGPVVVETPSRDPDLLDPAFLGPRAADLAAVADPARTFVVAVRHPGVDGAAAGTENLVVAPIDGDWRIWIDATPGLFGAWPFPEGCSGFGLSPRRCEAVVAAAASQAGVERSNATSIWLLPEPGCGEDPLADTGGGCVRTMSFVAGVRFDLPGADPVRTNIFCGVGPPRLVCSETPGIEAIDFHAAGYWDVPCAGEAPDGCASPLPSLSAAAADAGTELRLDSVDVPVGTVGHREVDLGAAVLVDGIVQEARFSIADEVQDGFLLADGTVRMELRSTIPGRPPFDNAYSRGTFDGPEEVRVVLVFDVAETSSDAVIHVTDVLVR
jgi:hypothetical protein